MAVPKITKQATVDVLGTGQTVGELIGALEQLPPTARFTVKSYKGDPRDQRDGDWAQLIVHWTD